MRYSFIEPREHRIIDLFSKIWIFFILFNLVVLTIFNIFFKLKTEDMKNRIKEYNNEQKLSKLKINELESDILLVKKQKSIAEEVEANNLMLKGSIKNLFDLVPDKITLNKVYMNRSLLIIHGITPSKDSFNFLLGTPLKSIFHSSKTIFYLQKDGWYRFVSTNKIVPKEDIVEK